jgi:hypothetical protein
MIVPIQPGRESRLPLTYHQNSTLRVTSEIIICMHFGTGSGSFLLCFFPCGCHLFSTYNSASRKLGDNRDLELYDGICRMDWKVRRT